MELTVLSGEQVNRIHEASIAILARTGVGVPHGEMRKRFAAAGAQVDEADERVRIPESVVMECLDVAGKQFTLYGRDRTRVAAFGQGTRNYNSAAGEALWVDDGFSNRRYTTLSDVRTAAVLGDALPEITIVGAMADPLDIPREYRCVAVAAEQIRHTTKPITFWFYDRASAKFVIELMAAVAGSEAEAAAHPLAYPLLEAISPLHFPHDGIDLLFETCTLPLPVHLGPMAQTGATAPGTLAATLAQENAEILASLCIVQLVRRGTPVCYGGIPHIFDMRTAQMVFAGPEQALMAVAMTQMGKSYGLPVYINVGLTDSKTADAQAGLEIGITLACGALAGADIFGHLGICGVDLGSSAVMLVLQHEVVEYVERLMRGIDISDETLGLDEIDRVGPSGNFLASEFTALHFRRELWFPRLLDRAFWEPWVVAGHADMFARCREMKEAILACHKPVPLDDDTDKAVDEVMKAARRYLLA
ncbi:MAG TPA: trimethylamine methyltransferase family protein [Candidatus Hydrogenedentes bacterium]|nr:trimethylamine methyltransferase family protein [Candidatus Hydrogenedentota bacterium]HPG69709.1 trimethylamine methyltransferase family protein [Candidatus Hydrogenedentota bacterium]